LRQTRDGTACESVCTPWESDQELNRRSSPRWPEPLRIMASRRCGRAST
jgi:hypothetical protein